MNLFKLPIRIIGKRSFSYLGGIFLLLILVLNSCKTPKNTTAYYFKTIKNDTTINTSFPNGGELKIRKSDLLSINISSLNKEEDNIYNAPAMSGSIGTSGAASVSGYLVDAEGNIQLHKLGILHVEGMTRALLKNKIQKDISPYLKDPVVTVRYLNHKITVLGEVAKPQVISMPEEQLSLLDVLGASGDVTAFARRENILVIRENGTGKEFKRINLEDHSVFTSKWYWLQPDDVVYIEPNDKKINEEDRNRRNQNLAIGLSAMSIIITVLSRLIK